MRKIFIIFMVTVIFTFTACNNDATPTLYVVPEQFVISDLNQFWDGNSKQVDIKPKEQGISVSRIYYNNKETPPAQPGRYQVTFDVTDIETGAAMKDLNAGTLSIILETDSTAVLRTQLLSCPRNTVKNPVPIKLNIGLEHYQSFLNVISVTDRFVDMDLSDSTGAAITGKPSATGIDYKITSVLLPSSLSTIDCFAFANFSYITDMVLPQGILTIEEYAFLGCRELVNIVLPKGLVSIGKSSFFNCQKLETITIPPKVLFIEEWAFMYTGLKQVTIESASILFNGNFFPFPGNLNTLYLEGGGIGTYIRPDASNTAWTKQQ